MAKHIDKRRKKAEPKRKRAPQDGTTEQDKRPRIFFHRTTSEAARNILARGFKDSAGCYLTDRFHSGVWLSDVPLDANQGAKGDELLAVVIGIADREADEYEWREEGKPISEWLFPANLLNERATVLAITGWEGDIDFERRVAEMKIQAEKLPGGPARTAGTEKRENVTRQRTRSSVGP